MFATAREIKNNQILAYDILVCEGGTIGFPKFVKNNDILSDPIIIQNSVHRLRFKQNQRFGFWIMQSAFDVRAYDLLTNSVSIAHLTKEKLEKFKITLPKNQHQNVISDYLDTETSLIDKEISLLKSKQDLLIEKRKALIFEAVTGKIDCRSWTA